MKIVIAFKQNNVNNKVVLNEDGTINMENVIDKNIIKNILDNVKNLDVIKDEKKLIKFLEETNITFLNIYVKEKKKTKNYIVSKRKKFIGPKWITILKESIEVKKRNFSHKDIQIETLIGKNEIEVEKYKTFITTNDETIVKEAKIPIEKINKIKKEKFKEIIENLKNNNFLMEEENEIKTKNENILTPSF